MVFQMFESSEKNSSVWLVSHSVHQNVLLGARHLVENHFVDATSRRIRQNVDATYRQIRQFVDFDNPSKFRRKMSKFRRQLNLRTIHTMQLHIRLYSEFYEYPN